MTGSRRTASEVTAAAFSMMPSSGGGGVASRQGGHDGGQHRQQGGHCGVRVAGEAENHPTTGQDSRYLRSARARGDSPDNRASAESIERTAHFVGSAAARGTNDNKQVLFSRIRQYTLETVGRVPQVRIRHAPYAVAFQ